MTTLDCSPDINSLLVFTKKYAKMSYLVIQRSVLQISQKQDSKMTAFLHNLHKLQFMFYVLQKVI